MRYSVFAHLAHGILRNLILDGPVIFPATTERGPKLQHLRWA